ncbi:sigma-70 family RNA polymerase sigma factor [Amycolatopsis sp. NPDC051071]|uniref:RNA polymerase sigma factor n=1 Tax=Amycolatopsis sp. NPDC051071 TaxID=3154637 RepID=UPI0034135D76
MDRHRVPVLEEAFEAFYEATVGRTYAAIYRVAGGDEFLARDAVQEAYLALWKLWPDRGCRAIEDNRRYVQKIAVHKILDVYRTRWWQVEFDNDLAVPDADTVFDEILDELSVWALVRQLLSRQPPRR